MATCPLKKTLFPLNTVMFYINFYNLELELRSISCAISSDLPFLCLSYENRNNIYYLLRYYPLLGSRKALLLVYVLSYTE